MPVTAPIRSHRRPLSLLTLVLLSLGPVAAAHPMNGPLADPPPAPVAVTPKPLPITAPITAVTLYQGRAAVTRATTASVAPGVWEARFEDLPGSVIRDSLQATVTAPAKLLDVRFEETQIAVELDTNPEAAAIRAELQSIRTAIGEAGARHEALGASIKLLDAIAIRFADQTSKGLGSDALDPAKLAAQILALAEQRETLGKGQLAIAREVEKLESQRAAAEARLAALGGSPKTRRSGVVTIAMPTDASTPTDLSLTYLVSGATWLPSYSIRAAADLSGLQIDYDALIRQRTGEAWENVALTLSTAQPTRAAEPVRLDPIYVALQEEQDRMYAGVTASKSASPPPPMAAPPAGGMDGAEGGDRLEDGSAGRDASRASAEATVVQSATAATFVLPRTVTLASDAQRDQTTRIDSIALTPTYTYVTRPAVDASAYLRGTTRNTSPFQLLAGQARVFLGGDSIGVTNLEDIAPGGEFDLWFGADKRIDVERKLVARNTSTSGLISKSDDIEWQYRVTLKNAIAAATAIEVWDRIPVSRDEEVVVTLRDVSPALSSDKKYEANEKKQGLLKWSLTMPAATEERGPSSMTVSWTVKLSKPEKRQLTPLPE